MNAYRWSPRAILGAALVASLPALAAAQGPDPDEDREREVIDRFAAVLERMPRRGTALDRVYGHHVERGTLDQLIRGYADRAEDDPADGASWMMIGLLEAQRGRDAEAASAFERAEEHRADDPLAPFYLGQSLVLVGRPDDAVSAFERAIGRRPQRADLLEIYQALGRVHQRAGRSEEALAVWDRLEAQFPDDPRVKEQIAVTLVEEGEDALALPRLEALADAVDDPFRRVQFRVEAAEAKARLGRSAEALADFEDLLGRVNPESWLYRDVRSRIEDVFLRGDDLSGLATYYDKWIAEHPDDVEAMARLGRTLASLGRLDEARGRLEKAVEAAPTNKGLRLALIDQLERDGRRGEAAAQYAQLVGRDPRDSDAIRSWGRLLLDDAATPEPDRKRAAADVWRKLIDARPDDAVTAAQVADLMRQAGLEGEALGLYRRAVELAPESPQYREYLGEYLHVLKRPDEALASWEGIAEGSRRTAGNLGRLAEVLAGFGYDEPAAEAAAGAVALDGDDFDLRIGLADLLARLARFDPARAELRAAEGLADAPERLDAVVARLIDLESAAGTLADRVAELRLALADDPDAPAEAHLRLARFLEASRELPEAVAAARGAVGRDGGSVRSWSTLARLLEKSGELLGAAEAHRTIAGLDRRSRADAMAEVAKLEARLGRRAEAIAAGREVIAASPGNPESYRFLADLCFQLGEAEEGLDALRRASRANPNDPSAMLTLAAALAERFRTDEAIELYWRAFDRTRELEGRLDAVGKLAELYLQKNLFDRLIGRLEQQLTEADQRRLLALCKAQAYTTAGDLGTARQELERLLATDSRDEALLGQLVRLSEAEGDFATAAEYQQQLVDASPSDEAREKLADFYLRSGDSSKAEALWAAAGAFGREPHRIYQAADRLIAAGKAEAALPITERALRERPDDWQALFREGAALADLGRAEGAVDRFRALLALDLDPATPSAQAEARRRMRNAFGGQPAGMPSTPFGPMAQPNPVQQRLSASTTLKATLGLDPRYARSYAGGRRPAFDPADYGQARLASLAYLMKLARGTGSAAAGGDDPGRAEAKSILDAAGADGEPAEDASPWDRVYLASLGDDPIATYEAALFASKQAGDDPEAAWLYLTNLGNRGTASGPQVVRQANLGNPAEDDRPPMPGEELDHALACYRTLERAKPEWASPTLVSSLLVELEKADRDEEAEAIYREAIAGADSPQEIAGALALAARRKDAEAIAALMAAHDRQRPGRSNVQAAYQTQVADALARAIGEFCRDDDHDAALAILDRYLDSRAREVASAPPWRSGSTLSSSGTRSYMQIYAGPTQSYIDVEFPTTANAYLDYGAVLLLRNAFEAFKAGDLLSDLVAHLERREAEAPEADRVFPALGLCYLRWWADERDEAIDGFRRVVEQRGDAELTLILAEVLAGRDELDEALGLVESVAAVDQRSLQRREVMALELSVRAGDVDRARSAAERLFGLRLETDLQVLLAQQMDRLGMAELAEAVLARARRRAGNRASALVSLMRQYQAQDRMDVALQIAHQILRRSRGVSASQTRYVGDTSDPAARQAALQLLERSGQLGTLIERAEAQLEATPGSALVLRALADYYQAAGDRDKALDARRRMVEASPDDAAARFDLGMQLVQANRADEAIALFKQAVAKDPSLFGQRFYEMQNAYRRAGKSAELLALLDGIDLRSIGQYHYVAQLVDSLAGDEATRGDALALFRRAWEAFVDERPYLMSYVNRNNFNKLPEMYDFAREAIVPSEGQRRVVEWQAIGSGLSYYGDGRVVGTLNNLLDLAIEQGKLDALADEVERARDRLPGWTEGAVILGLIRARQERYDEARTLIAPAVADEGAAIPGSASHAIGSELDRHAALQDLAIAFLKKAMWDRSGISELQYGPMLRLIGLYRHADREDDARALLREAIVKAGDRASYRSDPAYASYQVANNYATIADEYAKLGDPIEAVRIFGQALAEAERPASASPNQSYYVEQKQRIAERAQQGIERAIGGIDADSLAPTLASLFSPDEGGGGDRDGPAVELVLLVAPRDLERAAVTSLVDQAIRASGEAGPLPDEVIEAVRSRVEASPEDPSSRVAAALVAFATAEGDAVGAEVDRLVALLARLPLDDLSEDARPNARQRIEASRQLGLWLVARRCWDREGLAEAGDRLASRALEAARRQSDPLWSLAMLREWGQALLDRGDREAAERTWARMLELILPRRVEPASPAAALGRPEPGGPVRFASQEVIIEALPGPAAAPAPAAAGPGRVPPTTPERFRQATQLARLAASNGMHELSLRAVRQALEGGPPVSGADGQGSSMMAVMSGGRSGMMVRAGDPDQANPSMAAVLEQLAALHPLWERHEAPADAVYEALRDVVIPASRPDQILPYAQPLALTGGKAPRSVAALLVDWAGRAGRLDELGDRVDERAALPPAEAPARAVRVLIAAAADDDDRANRELAALADRVASDPLRPTAEAACLAALATIDDEATRPAAVSAIEASLDAFERTSNDGVEEPMGGLSLRLAEVSYRSGDPEGARARLDRHLELVDRGSARNDADYATYRRLNALGAMARSALKGDDAPFALDLLGRAADEPPSRYGAGVPEALIGPIARRLDAGDPAGAFDRLRDWTFPTDDRRSLRLMASYRTAEDPPALFGGQAADPGRRVASTADLLLDAAEAAGRLDELAEALDPLTDEGLEHAETLRELARIRRGEGVDRAWIESRRDAIRADAESEDRREQPIPWGDLLVARACLADPALRDDLGVPLAEALADRAKAANQGFYLAQLRDELIEARVASMDAEVDLDAMRSDPGLARWMPSDLADNTTRAGGTPPTFWAAHEGHVAHLVGPGRQHLVLDTPLTGTFEIAFDAYKGDGAGAEVAFGGLVFDPLAPGSTAGVMPLPGAALTIPSHFARDGDFNRIVLRVVPDSVRCLVNGHLFFEDATPSAASPWLALAARGERRAFVKNVEIRGEPTIPREVALVDGGRMDGWWADYHASIRPRPLPRPEAPGQPARAPESDWRAEGGTIIGRQFPTTPADSRVRWLAYHRPMGDGEALSYEFLYEPGRVEAHPTLGRIAFLVEPGGVRLRWIGAPYGPDQDDPAGVASAAPVAVEEHRRGTGSPPLVEGEWNAVTLSRGGGAALLRLNGELIYEYPLDDDRPLPFGFYHDSIRAEARVRAVVLRGGWPDRLPADLFEPSEPEAEPAVRLARHALIGEAIFAMGAADILRAADREDGGDRFDRLARWVLPNEDHPGFRLAGAFTPTDPAPPVAGDPAGTPGGARVMTGGALIAPAIALVEAARESGRLDALADRVAAIEPAGDADRRGRLALLALAAIAREDDDAAAEHLEALGPLLDAVPADAPPHDRWPELVAADRALGRPGLVGPALALLDAIDADPIDADGPSGSWEVRVRNTRARARVLAEGPEPGRPFGVGPDSPSWSAASHARAATRGAGAPLPRWEVDGADLIHRPGHARDLFYLNTPLLGDFEVRCKLSGSGRGGGRISYGGIGLGLLPGRDRFERLDSGRPRPDGTIDPPFAEDEIGAWYDYRLEIEDGTYRAYINDRLIHEEGLPDPPDPWLAAFCRAETTGGVRDLTISGSPSVPDRLDLSHFPDLTGWLAEYYDESASGDFPDWYRRGEEIVGRGPAADDGRGPPTAGLVRPGQVQPAPAERRPVPGSDHESLLQYHRPMLEDGAIAYEFFYAPGEAMVHPALDRLVFLIEPEGVAVHWLTDGRHDRTGLPPGNRVEEPDRLLGPEPPPLVAQSWNRVELTIEGDTATLALNDEPIYERPIEPTNQRTFGLFHYADRSEARVRRVSHRGDWPRVVPSELRP